MHRGLRGSHQSPPPSRQTGRFLRAWSQLEKSYACDLISQRDGAIKEEDPAAGGKEKSDGTTETQHILRDASRACEHGWGDRSRSGKHSGTEMESSAT